MEEMNSALGTVVREKLECVALATPTDLRRRAGLKERDVVIGKKKVQPSDMEKTEADCRWRNTLQPCSFNRDH